MNTLALSFLVVALASVFQGTFGLGMKYIKPLAWEAWWLVYSAVAMVVLPIAAAAVLVPHLGDTIAAVPGSILLRAAFFGFLWGVGGILFGKSVERIGVALTYGIVMGLAASVGSLLPLLGQTVSPAAMRWIIIGNALILAGVALAAWAGVRRERATRSEITGTVAGTGGNVNVGLAMGILSGLLSAFLNVGFASAQPVAASAVAHGAIARNASLAAWVVVLAGAFVMNAAYTLFLLAKNKSWSSFSVAGAAQGYKWSIVTGFLWFAALAVYGQGAALMGSLGPVVGWPMLLGFALVLSNLLAVRAGEWRGAPIALRWMMAALTVLLVACCCLGYSNHATGV